MTNKKFRQRPNHFKYKFDESKFVQACQEHYFKQMGEAFMPIAKVGEQLQARIVFPNLN